MEASKIPLFYEKKDRYNDASLSGLLAEQLPPDYAYNRYRQLSTRKTASGRYRSAFAHIELALCEAAPIGDELRSNMLYDCNYILTRPMGLDRHPTTDTLRLSAAIACSYLPVFKKRALGQPITDLDCDDLYKSLGSALTMSQTFAHEPASIYARLAEGLMLALSLRTRQPEHILWPASPREEETSDQPSNHDGYFIVGGRHKLRVQTKLINTDKRYTDPTIMLVVEELLTHVSKKSAKKHQLPIATLDVNELIDIVFRESSGMGISHQEKHHLDLATARLVKPLSVLQKSA